MGTHNGFGQASGLEEREAQENRVPHDAPDASDDVIRKGDRLDQHRIDADADHDQVKDTMFLITVKLQNIMLMLVKKCKT